MTVDDAAHRYFTSCDDQKRVQAAKPQSETARCEFHHGSYMGIMSKSHICTSSCMFLLISLYIYISIFHQDKLWKEIRSA